MLRLDFALCFDIKRLKQGSDNKLPLLSATGRAKGSNFVPGFVLQNHSGFHTWIKLGTLTQQRACTWRTSGIKLTEWEADDYISEITWPAMSTSMNWGGLNLLMDYMDCRE